MRWVLRHPVITEDSEEHGFGGFSSLATSRSRWFFSECLISLRPGSREFHFTPTTCPVERGASRTSCRIHEQEVKVAWKQRSFRQSSNEIPGEESAETWFKKQEFSLKELKPSKPRSKRKDEESLRNISSVVSWIISESRVTPGGRTRESSTFTQ